MSEEAPLVAVVTGASRGIGARLASAFADAGYVVEACSRNGAPGVAAVDVTDSEAVNTYVSEVLARHGHVDVLVNNAGVTDDEVPLHESDPEQWWRTVEVNVRGPYLLTRALLPHMLQRGSGRVINLNSGAGTRPGRVTSAYYLAKSALGRLTGSTHLAGDGKVFAFDLAPGVVRTDMTLSMPVHDDRTEWTSPDAPAELAVALASGRLDAWSGRMVRAGVDTPQRLEELAAEGLTEKARTVGLFGYGPNDPVA